MKFLPKLREWGKKHIRTGDPKRVLTFLHIQKEMPPRDIGAKFKESGRTVRLWMDIFGVAMRTSEPQIVRAAKARGFDNLAEYIQKRWAWSFERMGAELKVAPSTVSEYYEAYVREIEDTRVVHG